MERFFPVLVLLCFLALPSTLLAVEYQQFQKDSIKAYHFYKKSLALTSKTENKDKALVAVDKFVTLWQQLATNYADNPPTPFVGQDDYAEQLNRPVHIGQQALKNLQNGEVKQAHSVLEEVRYLLWEMRTNVGLVSLSDKINDFHEAMEVVLEQMHAKESAEEGKNIGQRYGAWLAIKWEDLANAELLAEDRNAFDAAMLSGRKAIAGLREKLSAGDIAGAKAASKAMKKSYKAIFFLDSTS